LAAWRAAIVVFDLDGYSLAAGQHPIQLSGSGLNDLQQDFTNIVVFIRTKT